MQRITKLSSDYYQFRLIPKWKWWNESRPFISAHRSVLLVFFLNQPKHAHKANLWKRYELNDNSYLTPKCFAKTCRLKGNLWSSISSLKLDYFTLHTLLSNRIRFLASEQHSFAFIFLFFFSPLSFSFFSFFVFFFFFFFFYVRNIHELWIVTNNVNHRTQNSAGLSLCFRNYFPYDQFQTFERQ